MRISDALRLFAKDHLVNQMPIAFDNLRVFGGKSTCISGPNSESVAVRLTII
jgi:hypothetical protein